jgi:flagellin
MGSSSKRIDVQSEFTIQLVDILKEGVGNLVDADLAEESAALQSLQIKQQLGVQALSIANSGPQSILALFG